MALDHARTVFYVVQKTAAEFGLHSDNKKLSTKRSMCKIYADTSKNVQEMQFTI